MDRRRGKAETLVSAAVLLTLLLIGAGVAWKQSRYDPDVFTFSFLQQQAALLPERSALEPRTMVLDPFLPPGLKPFGNPEGFHEENLSDKIDGKAEFYLSAGFESLTAQRFASENVPGQWMEVFVYDMGDHRNAFAVYSGQKRSGAEELDLAAFAYRTDNALFFAQGRHYVEIIASAADPAMQEMMLAFGQKMAAHMARPDGPLDELALLPDEGLDRESVYLIAADAFGFDALNNVLTARYGLGEGSATVFLSVRSSAEEARNLAASFGEFLRSFGAEPVSEALGVPQGELLQVFDTYEAILHHGPILYGVHEAPEMVVARDLADRLHGRLAEMVK